MKTLKLLWVVSILFFTLTGAPSAFAFPGMIRNGYVNCSSCHISPTGDGVLSAYGRETAGSVLSTWSKDGEGNFLYGATNKLSDAWSFGGDDRFTQTYENNPVYREKRFFLMQFDVEAAYRAAGFTVDLELGYLDTNTLGSQRHYVMYNLNDENALRLGMFKHAFGIQTDDHYISTRSGLGWGIETETYNLEYSRLTDNYSLYATALLGAPESVSVKNNFPIGQTGMHDHGVALRASKYFADRYELGASYFYGARNGSGFRHVMGPFMQLGFTKNFFYLGEVDFQNQTEDGLGWGIFDYQKLCYEFVQGLQFFVTQELSRPEFSGLGDESRLLRYGVGLQFFPRPHFELDLRYNIQENLWDEQSFNKLAWVMLHFYM